MRPRSPRRRRPSALAGAAAILGLLVYLLPIAAAMPRPALGGAADRTPGIVFARHRQVQLDAVSDDRPAPGPHAPTLPSACVPAVRVPEPSGCSSAGDSRHGLAAHRPLPGTPRSPPAP